VVYRFISRYPFPIMTISVRKGEKLQQVNEARDFCSTATAKREFAEETGYRPRGKSLPLGAAKQPGEKIVHAWAVEGDWDTALLKSSVFEMEWPPKSGRKQPFPELDRAGWFGIAEARARILKAQAVFLDRLAAVIAGS
jgi:predicted NUDIX family NTP pyrophosphohydrolase